MASRSIPLPTRAEIDHGVPLFLNQLVDALRSGTKSSAAINRSATLHGHDLMMQGFTISQVVRDYGDVCQSITELAIETQAPIDADDFRLLNACLDDAIAGALTQFGREVALVRAQTDALREQERLGFFAHELRNLLNTAMLSYSVIKSGAVGIGGSTGTIMHRSLQAASDLVAQSLAELTLTEGTPERRAILVVNLVNELLASAILTADASQIAIVVSPVSDDIAVEVDPIVISSALLNLLQNAVKFTRPNSTVTVRVEASADRVRIEVQDECGGLPMGNAEDLFRPFQQRGENRSGVGLGLTFSRRAVEAHRGHLDVQDLPGRGCVFTVDLPRVPVPALAF